MGKRGPPKQPTVLRLLRGNLSKRKINEREPKPDADQIVPPEYLAGASLAKWNQVLPGLVATGVITNADVETLARYCTMYEMWLRCLESTRKSDKLWVKDREGQLVNVKSLPDAVMLTKLAVQMLRIEQEFGLTPSARSGIVGTQKKAQDDLADFTALHG